MRALRSAIGVMLLWAALCVQPLAAQAPTADSTVVLVMESGGGMRAASELRAALNRRPDVHLVSLAEAARAQLPPTAVLAVATDPTRVVNVIYWDLDGNADALAAPAPSDAGQINAVVLALASALLDRHRPELASKAAQASVTPPALDLMRTSRALYAMLGRLGGVRPRTDVQLRVEDF
jgi:hypothetical protein